MWFMEEPSQFSVGQPARSLTCFIMEKPQTGLDNCLRILLSCFRKRRSALSRPHCQFHDCERDLTLISASKIKGCQIYPNTGCGFFVECPHLYWIKRWRQSTPAIFAFWVQIGKERLSSAGPEFGRFLSSRCDARLWCCRSLSHTLARKDQMP